MHGVKSSPIEAVYPLYFIIDEDQTIERLEALERILSESAKYGLLMGLAHQNMAQLSRRELPGH
jgi:type IV secretory pathway TraG/TraD family ATPase VirD4